jgi:hypothetical protein
MTDTTTSENHIKAILQQYKNAVAPVNELIKAVALNNKIEESELTLAVWEKELDLLKKQIKKLKKTDLDGSLSTKKVKKDYKCPTKALWYNWLSQIIHKIRHPKFNGTKEEKSIYQKSVIEAIKNSDESFFGNDKVSFPSNAAGYEGDIPDQTIVSAIKNCFTKAYHEQKIIMIDRGNEFVPNSENIASKTDSTWCKWFDYEAYYNKKYGDKKKPSKSSAEGSSSASATPSSTKSKKSSKESKKKIIEETESESDRPTKGKGKKPLVVDKKAPLIDSSSEDESDDE